MAHWRYQWLGGILGGLVLLSSCCDEKSLALSPDVVYLETPEAQHLEFWRRQAGLSSREEYIRVSLDRYAALLEDWRHNNPAAYQCNLSVLRYGGAARHCETVVEKAMEKALTEEKK